MRDKKLVSSTLYLIAAQCMLSTALVASKNLLLYLHPFMLLLIRFGGSVLILSALHLTVTDKKKYQAMAGNLFKINWVSLIIQALCAGAIFNILFLKGLQTIGAGTAGILSSALPIVVMIFSILFLREKPTAALAICVVFACIGIVLVNYHPGGLASAKSSLSGSIWVLLSLLPEAGYYVLCKRNPISLPPLLLSAIMNIINFIFFSAVCLIFHEAIPHSVSLHNIILLIITCSASALFYVFWFLGCQHVSGFGVAIAASFMPVATIVLAVLFLKESITMLQLSGMIIIIAAVLISMTRKTRTQVEVS